MIGNRVGFGDLAQGLALVALLPAGLRPDFSRRLPVRRRFCFPAGGLLSPSLDGGLPLLVLFRPSRRSSSSSRAARDSTKSISSSFSTRGQGLHDSLDS